MTTRVRGAGYVAAVGDHRLVLSGLTTFIAAAILASGARGASAGLALTMLAATAWVAAIATASSAFRTRRAYKQGS